MDDFLDNDNLNSLSEYIKEREFAYEEKVVKQLLKNFSISDRLPYLKSRCKAKTGRSNLQFEWFNDLYPDFPVFLTIRRIPYVHKVTFKNLFGNFTTTPIYKALEDVIDISESSLARGVVFNWPGIGTMVMHDLVTTHESDAEFVRKLGPRKIRFTIETFGSFCEKVASIWTPGTMI